MIENTLRRFVLCNAAMLLNIDAAPPPGKEIISVHVHIDACLHAIMNNSWLILRLNAKYHENIFSVIAKMMIRFVQVEMSDSHL